MPKRLENSIGKDCRKWLNS